MRGRRSGEIFKSRNQLRQGFVVKKEHKKRKINRGWMRKRGSTSYDESVLGLLTMGQPIVHFETIGKDAKKLRSYYGDLFGWEFDTNAPVAEAISQPGNYGFVIQDYWARFLLPHEPARCR